MQVKINAIALMLITQTCSVCVAQSTIEPRQALEPQSRSSYRFGTDVDASGAWAIASSFPGGFTANGDIIFYQRVSGIWTEKQHLNVPAAYSGDTDGFGFSVAIDGDLAAVGAPFSDPFEKSSAGRVFIYRLNSGAWSLEEVLDGPYPVGKFGYSVDVYEELVAVGAPGTAFDDEVKGKAYVYEDPDMNKIWTRLGSELRSNEIQAATESFGNSVSLSENTANEPLIAVGNEAINKAYTYRYRPVNDWDNKRVISATMADEFNFGHAVSLDGERLAISSHEYGVSGMGSVGILDYIGSNWSRATTLTNGVANTRYGIDIDLEGDSIVVGSEESDFTVTNNGVAYEYRLSSGTWSLARNYVFYEAAALLGHSVAISGNDVIAGGIGYNDPGYSHGLGSQDGVVCVFNTTDCAAADLNNDGVLNEDDVYEFLDLYNNSDPDADWNSDGYFNFFDVSMFIEDYIGGC